jgi:hypothetical protein
MRLTEGAYAVLLCLAGACRVPAQSLALTISSAPDTGALVLSLNSGDAPPAAVQWTVTYPPDRAIAISIAAGPSSAGAGKSIFCASTADSSTCLVSGLAGRALGAGVLATIAATGQAPAPIWITSAIAVSADGTGRALQTSGGGPGLQSIACSPVASASAAASCQIRLSAPAPRGGVQVAIAFDPGYVDAPWSVIAPEGATAVSFDVRPVSGRPSNGAAITASVNGATRTALVTLPAPGAAPGLIAAYAFDEGSGGFAYDYSGEDNTGWVESGEWTALGRNGGALMFDGERAFVNIGDPGGQSAADTAGSMTWSAWVYPTGNPPDDGQIVARSIGIAGWQLKTTPDTGPRTFGVEVAPESGPAAQRYSATTVALNTWYFVAGVYDAASRSLDIYVNGTLDNGVLAGDVPARQALAPVNANIGRRYGGFFFQGIIDDVRIYDRALSAAEIRADMETPVGAPAVPLARLESLSCVPASIPAGGDSTCTVTLSGPAREQASIAIASATPLIAAPPEITIPAGASTADFRVSAVSGPGSGRSIQIRLPARAAAISASYGPDTVRASVTVLPRP